MRGLMMNRPLLISALLDHAATVHHDQEIVSRTVEGTIHRYTYRDAHRRAKQLANVLTELGVAHGDRVGTIAWNGYRHFELYYGISGMGAVCHTMNPRLHPAQLAYIVNHAEDKLLFVDLSFLPLVEAVAGHLTTVEAVVVMTDRAHMPPAKPDSLGKTARLLCYEELMADRADAFEWPELDENTASSLCYTSGTTGHPKGVLYSHRSTVLHSFALALPAAFHMAEDQTVLPVVPMFHVNAWGLPYAAALTGTKLVFPGPKLDGESLTELLDGEKVTCTAGVPTVWLALLDYWRQSGRRVPSLQRVVIGGSAASRSMIEAFMDEFGIEVVHAWGMTETSPFGAASKLKPAVCNAGKEERYRVLCKQGRPPFGVEMRVVDDAGNPQPWDGRSAGELQVRGPWVSSGYFKLEHSAAHEDGWFDTGDVVTIDSDAYMQITDRTKDLIKSGGEWISSIDLENLAMGHPAVAQAAVIGIPDEKWTERPLLIVVPRAGTSPTKDDILALFKDKVANWWIPDDVIFVEEIPLGATGKVQKSKLRELYGRGAA